MNIAALKKKIKAQIADLQVELATLERIEARYGGASDLEINGQVGINHNRRELGDQSLIGMAMEAIESLPVDELFTKGDIVAMIRKKHPNYTVKEPSVSSLLWNLEKRGKIDLEVRGAGKKPSVYSKRDTTDYASDVLTATKTSNGNGATHTDDEVDF